MDVRPSSQPPPPALFPKENGGAPSPAFRPLRVPTAYFLLLPGFCFLCVFYLWPLFAIFKASLTLDLLALIETMRTTSLGRVVGFTFWQATLSTLVTLLIGLPGAYVLARYRFPGRALWRALTGVPFVMPTIVVAAAFNTLLGPRGWINLGLMSWLQLAEPPLNLLNSLSAIVGAHVFYNLTLVLRVVGDYWARLDPRLENAARTLGANRWQAFQHITWPLLRPAVASAALLVFLYDFTSFGVILLLGGPQFATLETEIYRQALHFFDLRLAAILSLIQLACTLLIIGGYARLTAHLTTPLKLHRAPLRPLDHWRTRWMASLVLGGILIICVTPLLALAMRSMIQIEADAPLSITFAYYRELFLNRRDALFYAPPFTAIGNSLMVALATLGLAFALGLPTAWALAHSTSSRFTAFYETLLMSPLGTSAVTLGLGFLVAFPAAWRIAPWLLPFLHTLVALPVVVRNLLPGLRGLRPALRRAATVLGASPVQVFWLIDLPLLARAILTGGALAFAISLGEFGATALLARPEFPTLPIAIYRFLAQPGALNYGQALALSVILMLLCAVGIVAIERDSQP